MFSQKNFESKIMTKLFVVMIQVRFQDASINQTCKTGKISAKRENITLLNLQNGFKIPA